MDFSSSNMNIHFGEDCNYQSQKGTAQEIAFCFYTLSLTIC